MKRIGRWIDFKNDYKTLDITFMESVWWVFKQLFEKGLVYRGFKVRYGQSVGTARASVGLPATAPPASTPQGLQSQAKKLV